MQLLLLFRTLVRKSIFQFILQLRIIKRGGLLPNNKLKKCFKMTQESMKREENTFSGHFYVNVPSFRPSVRLHGKFRTHAWNVLKVQINLKTV